MRILHVISTVGDSAPQELKIAQQLTLASMRRAVTDTRHLDVQIVATRFPDESLPEQWLIDAPVLTTSACEVWGLTQGPRLPLLAQVLQPTLTEFDYDVAVYTNIDIGLQPDFYQRVETWTRAGLDAVNVTRRNIDQSTSEMTLDEVQAQNGRSHPGADCFVFSPRVARCIDAGNVSLGLPPVGRTMAINLYLHANEYRKFGALHATFHLGRDADWRTNPVKRELSQLNVREHREVINRLADQFGQERVEVAKIECWNASDS
jgi:hypothetical protein